MIYTYIYSPHNSVNFPCFLEGIPATSWIPIGEIPSTVEAAEVKDLQEDFANKKAALEVQRHVECSNVHIYIYYIYICNIYLYLYIFYYLLYIYYILYYIYIYIILCIYIYIILYSFYILYI